MDSHNHLGKHFGGATVAAPDAPFSGLIQTATVEFLSSLQLLAERARFLSSSDSVAIALKQAGKFVYCASTELFPQAGSPAATQHAPIANCIATDKPTCVSTHTSSGPLVKAAIPIIREQQVAGFFELSASRLSFSNEDLAAVSAFAEKVNTALDHMEAAENVHQRILDSDLPGKAEIATPLSWHAAPQPEISTKPDPNPPLAPSPLKVHVCRSCGFPVSEGRSLCVECEQNPHVPHVPEPPLLAVEKDESWIGAHGYTLASLLVTALVVAIIYWLR